MATRLPRRRTSIASLRRRQRQQAFANWFQALCPIGSMVPLESFKRPAIMYTDETGQTQFSPQARSAKLCVTTPKPVAWGMLIAFDPKTMYAEILHEQATYRASILILEDREERETFEEALRQWQQE